MVDFRVDMFDSTVEYLVCHWNYQGNISHKHAVMKNHLSLFSVEVPLYWRLQIQYWIASSLGKVLLQCYTEDKRVGCPV